MDLNRLLGKPADQFAIDTQTNATATATITAPTSPRCVLITGVSISADRAPASPFTVQVKDGTTVIKQFEIPAAAFSPIEIDFKRGLICGPGNAAVITAGAGGASVKVTLGIAGILITQ